MPGVAGLRPGPPANQLSPLRGENTNGPPAFASFAEFQQMDAPSHRLPRPVPVGRGRRGGQLRRRWRHPALLPSPAPPHGGRPGKRDQHRRPHARLAGRRVRLSQRSRASAGALILRLLAPERPRRGGRLAPRHPAAGRRLRPPGSVADSHGRIPVPHSGADQTTDGGRQSARAAEPADRGRRRVRPVPDRRLRRLLRGRDRHPDAQRPAVHGHRRTSTRPTPPRPSSPPSSTA